MHYNWFTYSLLAAFFLAASFLLVKKASIAQISAETLTAYTWGISFILLFGYLIITKQNIHVTPSQFGIIALAAIAFLFGALLLNKGVYTAPNPGFATAIGSVQVLLVVLASVILFGSELTGIKILGSIAVIAGVVLLGL